VVRRAALAAFAIKHLVLDLFTVLVLGTLVALLYRQPATETDAQL
jgi:hypothetical protein